MGRTCGVCRHKQREAIEKALVRGEPFRPLAARFGTSATALFRHKADHLAGSLVKAHEAEDIARADSVLADVRTQIEGIRGLYVEAQTILKSAKRAKDLATALKAIRELSNLHKEERATFELVARLTGEVDAHKQAEARQRNAIVVIVPSLGPASIRRPVTGTPEARQLPAPEVIDVEPEPENGEENA